MLRTILSIFIIYGIGVLALFWVFSVMIDAMIYEVNGDCEDCLFLDLGKENLELPYPDVITDEERLDIYLEKYNGTVM